MMCLGDERKDGIYMAHMEKFKQVDLVPVLKEGFRDLKEYRNDVDETRTEQNYTFGCQTWKQVTVRAKQRAQEIMGDKKLNKKANPLFSWVVTYPKGRTSVSERDFFEGVRDYMSDLYGEANVMAVCVHMDETTPHCHCYIVPEAISRKTGERTVSTASLLDKKHLQKFHKEFDDYMYERFGECNLIERKEEDKAEENVSMLELKIRTKKAEIKALKEEKETVTSLLDKIKGQWLKAKRTIDAHINAYREKKEKELREYLERSQKLIEAEISDYRDNRVKEIEKELEPLEARKNRMENDIERMRNEHGDKFEAQSMYFYYHDKAKNELEYVNANKKYMSDNHVYDLVSLNKKKEKRAREIEREREFRNEDWGRDF